MNFPEWLTGGNSWGEALRNHAIAETFQDVQTFAGDLAQLTAQLYEDHLARACAHDHGGKTCLERPCADLCPRCNSLQATEDFQEKYCGRDGCKA